MKDPERENPFMESLYCGTDSLAGKAETWACYTNDLHSWRKVQREVSAARQPPRSSEQLQ
jgi:hypothetical protein